jgi:hypothetical protein
MGVFLGGTDSNMNLGATTGVPAVRRRDVVGGRRAIRIQSANRRENWGGTSVFRYRGVVRVVALLVVLCGCRASTGSGPVDASTPRGDGLAERVTTDAALWVDVRPGDGNANGDARGGDGGGHDGASDAGGDAAAPACRLLEVTCPARYACYPFPFEGGPPSGETRCSFQGIGRPSVPCQSQLECDGENICITPGQPDAVCLQRCDLNGPNCPPGAACLPVAGYPGVGACSL